MSRLNENQRSRIRRLLLQGRSIKSISTELGHHFNTIKKIEEDLRSKGTLEEDEDTTEETDDFSWREEQKAFEELLREDPTAAHEQLMFLMTSKLHERLATGNKVAYAEISMGYAKIFEMTRKYRNELRGKDDLMALPNLIKRIEKIEEELNAI